MKDYELVCILPPTVEDDNTTQVAESVSSFVQSLKGEVQDVKPWGRRRFAYPIKNFREGNYVELRFKLDPAASSDLERGLRLNESVLRYMLVRRDER